MYVEETSFPGECNALVVIGLDTGSKVGGSNAILPGCVLQQETVTLPK